MSTPPDEEELTAVDRQRPSTLARYFGVFVHLAGLLFAFAGSGFIITGVIYWLSESDFVRAQARHAFNWHATFNVVLLVLIVLTFGVSDAFVIPLAIVGLIGFPAILGVCLYGAYKAAVGAEWSYPLAYEFL